MGSLDPLAAFALQAVASAQAAIDEAVLNLGTLVENLRASVAIGDILTATVLPPENGVDRLQLLNQTVAAQLPPGIFPGETISLQVTGFTSTGLLVRNLGPDAEAPAPESPAPTPAQPPPVVPPRNAASPKSPAAGVPPSQTPARPSSASAPVAPPREIFVAASVRPNPQAPVPDPDGPKSPRPLPAELEARIAANRAAPPPAAGVRPVAPPRTPAAPPPLLKPGDVAIAVARAVVERSGASGAALPKASIDAVMPPPSPPPVASARPTPEAALLARLRVPISATTLAAARLVETAARSTTTAYEKLDALLAKQMPSEELVPLRSLLSFVGRLDLRNAAALPEQIAAYVSNVVSAAESKISAIVQAWSANVAEDALPGGGTAAQHQSGAPVPLAQDATLPPSLAVRAAEREVALAHDLKSALLALVANPPSGTTPQLSAAIRDALSATTAVQLNALQAQAAEPNTITISLPAYYHEHGAPAKLRISKDAPNGKQALDADNFHIAFVLDTAALGTVAIDLQTAGRSVSVDVKTETPRAAERFRTSLGDLRGTLEDMHYRVASAVAGVAPRTVAPAPAPVAPAQAPASRRPDGNVDAQA